MRTHWKKEEIKNILKTNASQKRKALILLYEEGQTSLEKNSGVNGISIGKNGKGFSAADVTVLTPIT